MTSEQLTSCHSNLVGGFAASLMREPDGHALFVDGAYYSYADLGEMAAQISAIVSAHADQHVKTAAFLGQRSFVTYASVLGILAAGRAFVPLNPKFPVSRSRKMFISSEADVIVVSEESLDLLSDVLQDLPRPVTVVAPASDMPAGLTSQFPQHKFLDRNAVQDNPKPFAAPTTVGADDIAYLLFTSGSTGEPKGVPVSHANATAYIGHVTERYNVCATDRVSQTFDLTFDLSVHDMFMAWGTGACLFSIPDGTTLAPAKFIRDNELTLWFSVPSVVGFMARLKLLRPGLFPSLRYSLFCGEALPEDATATWHKAAPNSKIENLYGPTEATIAITGFPWNSESSAARGRNGIVPIGWPFEGQQVAIVDENLRRVDVEAPGELLLAGSQITPGYWNDPEKTADRYVQLPGEDSTIWYRTGDIAVRDAEDCLYYLGRQDDQVKIRGFRVELQEIDHVLRESAGTPQAVAVAWPITGGSAEGVVAFICTSEQLSKDAIGKSCRETLPDYMVPRKILFVDEMPLNSNGKIDRHQLLERLEE